MPSEADPAAGHDPATPPPENRRRIVAAGIVGNILEWYDFALYGYLATVFATLFFPSTDHLASLISTYAVFAIGFLARPLGGLIYGHIGDRLGRKTQLTLSVVMMGVPTFLLGLLPTHATIGDWAPVLLLVLRFIQGISTGGEFSGSIVYLVEQAPPARRGLFGSLSNFGSMLGGLAGAGAAWLVVAALPTAALDDWGWRLPFICGIVITIGGLWLRIGIPESPVFRGLTREDALQHQPLVAAIRQHPKEIAITAGLNWAVSAGYYIVFVWLATDLSAIVGLPLSTALGLSTIGLLFGTLLTPLAGVACDRFGPRAILAIAGMFAVVGSVPLLLLAGSGTITAATLGQLGLAAIMAIYLGTLPAVFVSLHGPAVRCSSLSIGYNVAVAIFGGTAPLVATALVSLTSWQPSAGLYFALTAAIGLALLGFVPRSLAGPAAGPESLSHPSGSR